MDKNLEDVIGPGMKSGDFPDVIHLAVGQPKGLTETFVKDNNLTDLTDVLYMTVPGESATVGDKIIPGFTDTSITNPYGDGKTYLMPMFYSPCGLFYNAGLFEQKGWDVPKTWDEMWALGDKAKAEGISLFAYPTTGYFDALFYALLNETGGPEFFKSAMNYTDGIWQTPEAAKAFDVVDKLASYTEKTVPANGNKDNYIKNQQLILDNKALFMPNGTWVVGEMEKAPRADGFKWGFTALPALSQDGDRYSYTFFEQIWVPAKAENADLAKQFIAYLYSDEAASIFAKVGAVQPIKGMSDKLEGDNKLFYSIYDSGAKAAMGAFSTTDPVEGVSISDTVFGTVDSLVNKSKTKDQWIEAITKASDALRGALKN
ncbi:carbohydrate ABC transporter substrate-binding protein [Paenibacillus sp. D2_2]|uniref:carbohydrate ABC transporter substrate-binding protein n=1 Tax=Paenibacillus sp. D2_2 TaxID=3073092 RepID=UPI00281638B0|nr:carbohydrate ABC transporter substrate-binding protein [Paenibacillus sp. D2_2]WMT43593.1 carbohydrate ABC transporter substrate-binding protein [Paenibacillus sp. D2_2]